MDTPNWIVYLRNDADAWNDYLAWIAERRRVTVEHDPKTWDEEKERQGAKKALDNILHLSTIDQKNEVQLAAYRGGKKNVS